MTTSLLWFTHDLRLDDNRALLAAAGAQRLACFYIINPIWFKPGRYQTAPMGSHRWRFLKQCLIDLQAQLAELGQSLHLFYGDPVQIIPEIAQNTDANALICSAQHGFYERQTLSLLRAKCSFFIKTVETFTLFESNQGEWLGEKLSGYFTGFRKVAEQHSPVPPVLAPQSLPPGPMAIPGALTLAEMTLAKIDTQITLANSAAVTIPSDIRLDSPKGGSDAAKQHLAEYFSGASPASYKTTRNALMGWQNSSKFSFWLSHGCISARRVKARIDQYETEVTQNESTYWLYFELLWREYFQWLGVKEQANLFHFGGARRKSPLTSFYPERFLKWCQGQTPFPIVNACMRELAATGFLSNRGRQIVASCLVNELGCDWRYGAAWFEHQLIDYDVNSNWGNWQYIAGVGADPRGGRHFDLDKQQAQFDPEGHYRRHWLGENPQVPAALDAQDMVGWPI